MHLSTDFLLHIVVSATQRAAAVVRQTAASEEFLKSGDGRRFCGINDRHSAPMLDNAAQEAVIQVIQAHLGEYFVISEEAPGGILQRGEDSGDLCFIADPLDGSAFARRRIPLASSSLCAYSRVQERAIASAVTDAFLGTTYYTADHVAQAYMQQSGREVPLATSQCKDVQLASCAVLAADPTRFDALMHQSNLTSNVRWIFNNCGAIEICRIASGDLDLAVEFAKGFHIWDLVAAAHILEKAGGAIQSQDGGRLVLPMNFDQRIKFVAAASPELLFTARQTIDWS